MAINWAVEEENKMIAIKLAVQPESGSRHPRTFVGMLGENPSIQIAVLGRSFHVAYNNSMLAEALEEYVLALP